MIFNYLRQSEVYELSGETYDILPHLVENKRVLVIGDRPIEGVAIINKEREWLEQ